MKRRRWRTANTADSGEEGFESLFDVSVTEVDAEPIQQYITKLENGRLFTIAGGDRDSINTLIRIRRQGYNEEGQTKLVETREDAHTIFEHVQ